jgi:glucose/arabinose dehydrogenase
MFPFCGTAGAASCFLVALVSAAQAQPVPKIELKPKFPALALHLPVGMEQAPDGTGRFFILEQDGRMLTVGADSDGKDAKEFLNISDRKPHQFVEDGLLGLAFHPHFKSNGLFYIYYCLHEPRHSVLSELKVSSDPNRADMKSERVVLDVEQPFDDHKGGQLSFGPDGFLYLGLGDGGRGNDPFNNAQNTASILGKILRIDVDGRSTTGLSTNARTLAYGIPKDNPFVDEPELYEYGVRKEIWALGLRNPWRFSWDRETGEMWAADVGQDTWEEINLIVKGGNYGWNVREGAHPFKPGPEGARYIDPVVEYPHDKKLLSQSKVPDHHIGMCVIGGYVYRGKKYPALQGVYVYADYVLGTFSGFRYKNGKLAEHGTLLEQPKNITSLAQDLQGELYAIAYDGHISSIAVAGQ